VRPKSVGPVTAGLICALLLGFAGPALAQAPKLDLADIRSVMLGPQQPRAESSSAHRQDTSAFSALLVYADELQAQPRLIDRDRGAPGDAAPPTPPGIRVRTTAVREFG